jgi:hypothetical protein
VVLILVALTVSLMFWKFDTNLLDRVLGTWWISIVFYFVMVIPLVYCGPILVLGCIASCFVRIGGIVIAALHHYAGGQPYCKLPGVAFGVIYLLIGVLAASLAFFGGLYHFTRAKRLDFT